MVSAGSLKHRRKKLLSSIICQQRILSRLEKLFLSFPMFNFDLFEIDGGCELHINERSLYAMIMINDTNIDSRKRELKSVLQKYGLF